MIGSLSGPAYFAIRTEKMDRSRPVFTDLSSRGNILATPTYGNKISAQ